MDSSPDPEGRGLTGTKILVASLAFLAGLLAALVLFGWLFNIAWLKHAGLGASTMKANTAVAFLLSAILLALRVGGNSRASRLIQHFLAVAVLAIAVITLLEYLAGLSPVLDQLLFQDDGPLSGDAPGRMSILTALGFLCFATAMALPWSREDQDDSLLFIALSLAGLLIAFLSLVGYLYGAVWLYQPTPATSIAPHTAASFAFLFLGALASRPASGPMALLRDDSAIAAVLRRVLPAVVLLPILLGWLFLKGVEAGIYGSPTAIALVVIASVLLIGGLLWRTAERAMILDRALRNQERLSAAILEHGFDAVVRADEEGRVLEWNAQAESIFGWDRQEAVGQRMEDLMIPPGLRAAHRRGMERFLASGVSHVSGQVNEFLARRRDGSDVAVELVVCPLRLKEGWTFYGFLRDITERKRAEELLLQAQKLNAVGQLTGGVAHDFNNLLAIILGNLDMVVENPGLDARDRRLLESALGAGERGAALVKRLLAFARKQVLNPEKLQLAEVCESMLDLLRRTLGEQISIELKSGPDLWMAMADLPQVESALLNLAINARDAMPKGGKLTIETANVVLDESYAARHEEVRPGDYVMLAVSDSGSGMTPEVIRRAYEPFYTTKTEGRGSGLGLSMIYGFAKQSGGHLKIYSEPGHGTTVRLYLPRHHGEEEVLPFPAKEEGAEAPGQQETILVVEDEDDVRTTAQMQLSKLGYRVLLADGYDAALEILESDEPIDLLFTDVILSEGRTGRELSLAALDRRPGLKLLFTSGYTESSIVHRGTLLPGVSFLSKPYRSRELAAKVREALAERGGAADTGR